MTRRIWFVVALGLVETILLGRLLALLLAANPHNPFVALLLALSDPLAAPLAALDAAQPRFGSRFERGTLMLTLLLPLLGYALWRLAGRRERGNSYEQRNTS